MTFGVCVCVCVCVCVWWGGLHRPSWHPCDALLPPAGPIRVLPHAAHRMSLKDVKVTKLHVVLADKPIATTKEAYLAMAVVAAVVSFPSRSQVWGAGGGGATASW